MEDYIEMIYRENKNFEEIRVSKISELLNVNVSSASKMIAKLKTLNLVSAEKYELVKLTEKGKTLGKYLLERHNVINKLFQIINKNKSNLELVEQIEHFFDKKTVKNIKEFLKEYNYNE